MMGRLTAFHRTPGNPACTGRFHNTMTAAKTAGCICPAAVALYEVHKRFAAGERARKRGKARPREVNKRTVDLAVKGKIDFRALTTAERRVVVRHLATKLHMSDGQIAVRLRWSVGKKMAHRSSLVANFRCHWKIPAGRPLTGTIRCSADRNEINPDRVREGILGKRAAADLTTAERRQVVAYLAEHRQMSDCRIAVHLNWSPGQPRRRGGANVARFRWYWKIPAGVGVPTSFTVPPEPRDLPKAA